MLRKPRKPSERIFNRAMSYKTLVISVTMAVVSFVLWYWLINFTDMSESYARNIVLLTIVFMQKLLHVEPITFREWALMLAFAVPVILVSEVYKLIRNKTHSD